MKTEDKDGNGIPRLFPADVEIPEESGRAHLSLRQWITFYFKHTKKFSLIFKDDLATIERYCFMAASDDRLFLNIPSEMSSRSMVQQISRTIEKHIEGLQDFNTRMLAEFAEKYPSQEITPSTVHMPESEEINDKDENYMSEDEGGEGTNISSSGTLISDSNLGSSGSCTGISEVIDLMSGAVVRVSKVRRCEDNHDQDSNVLDGDVIGESSNDGNMKTVNDVSEMEIDLDTLSSDIPLATSTNNDYTASGTLKHNLEDGIDLNSTISSLDLPATTSKEKDPSDSHAAKHNSVDEINLDLDSSLSDQRMQKTTGEDGSDLEVATEIVKNSSKSDIVKDLLDDNSSGLPSTLGTEIGSSLISGFLGAQSGSESLPAAEHKSNLDLHTATENVLSEGDEELSKVADVNDEDKVDQDARSDIEHEDLESEGVKAYELDSSMERLFSSESVNGNSDLSDEKLDLIPKVVLRPLDSIVLEELEQNHVVRVGLSSDEDDDYEQFLVDIKRKVNFKASAAARSSNPSGRGTKKRRDNYRKNSSPPLISGLESESDDDEFLRLDSERPDHDLSGTPSVSQRARDIDSQSFGSDHLSGVSIDDFDDSGESMLIGSSDDENEARRLILKSTKLDKKPGNGSMEDASKKRRYPQRPATRTPRTGPAIYSSDSDSELSNSSKTKDRRAWKKPKTQNPEGNNSNFSKSNGVGPKGMRQSDCNESQEIEIPSSDSDVDSSKKSNGNKSDNESFLCDERTYVSDSDPEPCGRRLKILRRNFMSKRINNDHCSDEPSKKIQKGSNKIQTSSAGLVQSSSSDDDIQFVGTIQGSPKGRKNIRQVIRDDDLNVATKDATKEEHARKLRLRERQTMYNQYFQLPVSDKIESLVLDFDKTTKQPLLSVDSAIVAKLKPHQAKGIQFMWDACFESLEDMKEGGCILAHCMGLGKTLQTIGLMHTLLTSPKTTIKTVLVVCPLNTVGNWAAEIREWTRNAKNPVRLHKLWLEKGADRFIALKDWRRSGGIAIIHYDGFRTLVSSSVKKGKDKPSVIYLEIIQETLVRPGPDLVICDEGHLLKNASSQISKLLNKVETQRRIVLTGTPLQNNLNEYHTMMSFVKPSLLGTIQEFRNRFMNPILNGQHKDSQPEDVELMKKRAHVLHKLLEGCVQRLDYSVLVPFLPPKHEYVIRINLSEKQKDLYEHYINHLAGNTDSERENFATSKLFSDYHVLTKICTHPMALTYKSGASDAVPDPPSSPSSNDIDELDSDVERNDILECTDDEGNTSEKVKLLPKSSTPVNKVSSNPLNTDEGNKTLGANWVNKYFKNAEDMRRMELSGKLMVLKEILKVCESVGDKVLVFSQYISTLDIIEEFLIELDKEGKAVQRNDPRYKSIGGCPSLLSDGRYRHGTDYFRIDGSTKASLRQTQCDKFNEKLNTAKLFLISTRAGGLGINLVGANRCVIFESSWNPSLDLQAIFRIYRFGQRKPCYVYRLLSRGTMEEKIYNRQIVKLSLSCRVVDEQQIERHYHYDELRKMYQFNRKDTSQRPTPIVPKDKLLAGLLQSHQDWIFSYLEHDSLLENKEEEELSEDAKKLAWEEFNGEQAHKIPINITFKHIQELYDKNHSFFEGREDWVIRIAWKLHLLHPYHDLHKLGTLTREVEMAVQALIDNYPHVAKDTFNLPQHLRNAQLTCAENIQKLQHIFKDNLSEEDLSFRGPNTIKFPPLLNFLFPSHPLRAIHKPPRPRRPTNIMPKNTNGPRVTPNPLPNAVARPRLPIVARPRPQISSRIVARPRPQLSSPIVARPRPQLSSPNLARPRPQLSSSIVATPRPQIAPPMYNNNNLEVNNAQFPGNLLLRPRASVHTIPRSYIPPTSTQNSIIQSSPNASVGALTTTTSAGPSNYSSITTAKASSPLKNKKRKEINIL